MLSGTLHVEGTETVVDAPTVESVPAEPLLVPELSEPKSSSTTETTFNDDPS